jgi:SAM-dependent methyltransferase
MKSIATNVDTAVVDGFGEEWSRFDQSTLNEVELRELAQSYFSLVPWDKIGRDASGFDLGCGSGRWARVAAQKLGILHCIDASGAALGVARRNLTECPNVRFHLASVDHIPLPDDSQDFGYSLGVLHHVPDTRAGMRQAVEKLKIGAPFLVYLYYALDNRPPLFRAMWRATELVRRIVSRLPNPLRHGVSEIIAATVYLPVARTALALERFGVAVDGFPLSAYRRRSFYVMRTDALDRFGTRLEQRFTRAEVQGMMTSAGLDSIIFREDSPYWCALGYRCR